MKFTLSATKQETNDTFSFIFAPEEPLQWKAGRLLRYVLKHPNPDDRGVERFFSIASAPHEKHVMLTTRFAPKSSSFKKALKNLRPGDAIEAHDLEGDFVVDLEVKGRGVRGKGAVGVEDEVAIQAAAAAVDGP